MKHIILGTAGHIDHGKTTLIKALTGVDCDRLKEEKERGITIELGFTSLDLPEGTRVGIIDVPGHERFVHHMVAGVVGMDLVLLVIAADEGIMPQTREHLDICRLLGVKRGLVALTKTDLVDPEWLELVQEEIAGFVGNTFLKEARILPVSAATGEGLDSLVKAIADMVEEIPEHEKGGAFRLPVDRVFTMKGFGTVVTGALLSGEVRTGDTVEVVPQRIKVRVRGLQVHNDKVDTASAGQRTAINLQGLEKEAIKRGDVICQPDLLDPGYLLDARLTLLESAPALKNRTRIRLHTGTAEILGRVILLDRDQLNPGDACIVQYRLEEMIPVMPKDRYVIRRYSPIMTVGGGEIIDSHPEKHRRYKDDILKDLKALEGASAPDALEFYIKKEGVLGTDLKTLHGRTNMDPAAITGALAGLSDAGKVLIYDQVNNRVIHDSVYRGLKEKALDTLKAFHGQNPLKAGMSKEELKGRLSPDLETRLYGRVLEDLEKTGAIQVSNETCNLKGHGVSLSPEEKKMYDTILATFQKTGTQPPSQEDALSQFGKERKTAEGLIKLLLGEGKLARLKDDLLFHREALDTLESQVRDYLKDGKQMGIGEFKELTGLSRKFAVPILEYLDAQGVTMRLGDKRVLRKRVG